MYISVGRRMPQSPIVAVMEYPNDGDFPAWWQPGFRWAHSCCAGGHKLATHSTSRKPGRKESGCAPFLPCCAERAWVRSGSGHSPVLRTEALHTQRQHKHLWREPKKRCHSPLESWGSLQSSGLHLLSSIRSFFTFKEKNSFVLWTAGTFNKRKESFLKIKLRFLPSISN